jgi:hypothetical protein
MTGYSYSPYRSYVWVGARPCVPLPSSRAPSARTTGSSEKPFLQPFLSRF